MENPINTEKFCQYFFYGLDNSQEIIKGIIQQEAVLQKDSLFKEENNLIKENVSKKYKEKEGEIKSIQKQIEEEELILKKLKDEEQIKIHKKNKYKLEVKLFNKKTLIQESVEKEPILFNIQIKKIAKLLIQFRRFVTLNDSPYNKKYVFNLTEEMETAKQDVKNELKLMRKDYNNKKGNIYYIDYAPMSGIFYKDKKTEQEQWVKEVIQILRSLDDLEKNNIFQYYSTFIDVKYARAINRIKTGQIKNDTDKEEIKNVYKMFLKRKTSI